MSFPNFPYTTGGGKITPWNGQYYVATTQTVRRLDADYLIDPAFIEMNAGPYFSSFQGGDFHVYPDGRVLMGGLHELHDSIRGFTDWHCLIWFSNTGYLDTTQHHRKCAGSLNRFRELSDGKFIGSGTTSTWDGLPASNIFRFHPDGALDTTFHAHVWAGQAYGFLPLPDGRVYAAGNFRITGIPDTLQLVRFMPDGSLDPTFNHQLHFGVVEMDGFWEGGIVISAYQLDEGRLVVMGWFETVSGHARGHICLIDTLGNLLDDHFTGPGSGNNPPNIAGYVSGSVAGMVQAPDGSYYIHGSYHGYGDSTVTDTLQRMVTRLHALNVSVLDGPQPTGQLVVWPNPGGEVLNIRCPKPPANGLIEILDVQGRIIDRGPFLDDVLEIDATRWAPGLYFVQFRTTNDRPLIAKWVKQ